MFVVLVPPLLIVFPCFHFLFLDVRVLLVALDLIENLV